MVYGRGLARSLMDFRGYIDEIVSMGFMRYDDYLCIIRNIVLVFLPRSNKKVGVSTRNILFSSFAADGAFCGSH